ncbi:uncharacterized protein LOC105207426 isoform X3 [Solenopsis invicta]|uniref:uncharacterized protein LOC105207426 isoform X3 n=1 Tax=Solenopsis invicta TaxID=13686 RepID=UPI00193EB18F|nr:uncharacterized protein LOC105207426 isoform X3 [Solenopsis invicta]
MIKKERKNRAKTIMSSEESFNEDEKYVCLPSYPKLPQRKNLTYSENKTKTYKTTYKSKNILKQMDCENNNTQAINVSRHSNIEKVNTVHDENDIKEKDYEGKTFFDLENFETVNTSSTDIQRYIVRKLLDIDFKVGTVYEQQKAIKAKLDDMQKCIQTLILEDKAKKKENKIDHNALIMQVSRVGGTDNKSLTLNILRKTISDSVATIFSYVGGK